jgi:hypothetical protein
VSEDSSNTPVGIELIGVVGRSKEEARDRIALRADPAWIARVQAQADRLGIGLSAYIRQAVTRQFERHESEEPQRPRGKKDR